MYTVLPFSINASAISRIRSPQSSGKDDSATSISCNKKIHKHWKRRKARGREGRGGEREREKEGRGGEETKREGGRVERERRGRGMDVP